MSALKEIKPVKDIKIIPVGNIDILKESGKLCGYPFPLKKILSPHKSSSENNNEVIHVDFDGELEKGKITGGAGKHTYEILKKCTELCLSGKASGVITAPINKEALKMAGYSGHGHTEIFKDLSGASSADTVFCIERLKIFFLSRHVSLLEAISLVKKERILKAIINMNNTMKNLGVKEPVIGIPGLNPHCSDGGLFGKEEECEIEPAIKEAEKMGIKVKGPIGADSIYHLGIKGHFDAILSLYHDQGHIASKTYDFYKTITITTGLPFLRTSVDHGTAIDIAWKGKANSESLIRAIELFISLI